jgi:hypothetical protein
MKLLLIKIILAVMLGWFLAGCAGVPLSQPVNQVDGHIVQGGSFVGEGMIYFPLGLPNDKK